MKCVKLNKLIDLKQETVNNLMHEILNLKNLEELKLEFSSNRESDKSIVNHLKIIGIQCKNLKRFELQICFLNETFCWHILYNMSYFKKLRQLKIRLYSKENKLEDILKVKSLENCLNLTHLNISYDNLNDKFFE